MSTADACALTAAEAPPALKLRGSGSLKRAI